MNQNIYNKQFDSVKKNINKYKSYPHKTKLEMVSDYEFSYKTFNRRLKEYKIDTCGKLIPPKLQKEIYEKIGYPNDDLNSSS